MTAASANLNANLPYRFSAAPATALTSSPGLQQFRRQRSERAHVPPPRLQQFHDQAPAASASQYLRLRHGSSWRQPPLQLLDPASTKAPPCCALITRNALGRHGPAVL